MSKEWEIPDTWVWTYTGELADIIGGGTPSTTVQHRYYGGEIPWITPADLSGYSGKTISRGRRNLTAAGLKASSAQLIPEGSVLFSSRAPIGYVAIAANPLATNQGFKSFVPIPGVNSDYLYYCLQRVRGIALSLSRGTTFPEISAKNCGLIPIPLAPLNEQHRIVAEIEKHFKALDDVAAALNHIREDLRQYRASVLKAACQGKLVKTEAELARSKRQSYEPASKLLQRILKKRLAKWKEAQLAKTDGLKSNSRKANYIEPQEPLTSNLHELPTGWTWASLEQLSDETRAITYGVIKLGDHMESGIPTLRSSDVRHLRLDLDNVKKIAPEIANNYQRTSLQGGEVLLTVRGTLGGVVSVPNECKGFNISREVAMIALINETMSKALAIMIASPQLQNWLLKNAKGLAYTGINIETLKSMPVPLPPLAEQKRIVREVEERLRVADELEELIRSCLQRTGELQRSILKRAFEGRLVEPDTDGEPASVLLKRIAAERARRKEEEMKGKPAGRKRKAITKEEPLFTVLEEQKRELLAVFEPKDKWLTTEQLFDRAGYHFSEEEDVDVFFAALSKEISAKHFNYETADDEFRVGRPAK